MNYELRIKTQKNKAFTLVETLVAISIFTISILGILSVLASSITSVTYAKDKSIAGYLAQEGIEYMRNMRDTFLLYDSTPAVGWSSFQTAITLTPCEGAYGCYFGDLTSSNFNSNAQPMTLIPLTACTSATCANGPLLYDSSTGTYGYTTGTNSGFTRKILMIPKSGTEMKVDSIVYWKQGKNTLSITLSESLFDWLK